VGIYKKKGGRSFGGITERKKERIVACLIIWLV